MAIFAAFVVGAVFFGAFGYYIGQKDGMAIILNEIKYPKN